MPKASLLRNNSPPDQKLQQTNSVSWIKAYSLSAQLTLPLAMKHPRQPDSQTWVTRGGWQLLSMKTGEANGDERRADARPLSGSSPPRGKDQKMFTPHPGSI